MAEAEQLWNACAAALRATVPESAWRTCFQQARPVGLHDQRLVVSVPSSLVKERIEGRYGDALRDALRAGGAGDVEVVLDVRASGDAGSATWSADALEVDVDVDLDDPPGGVDRPVEPGTPTARDGGTATAPTSAGRLPGSPPALNPRYTFDAFVTGTSNRFAQAAALSVAETPARSYNPLFIYGHAGLGKTHLLHAIAHYVHQNYPTYRVRYVTTEAFLNDFVEAIRTNATTEFKRRYRESDVLLVDDVQFLENKEGLQEEFFHTFNELHGADRQIVLSSDRPPDSIATLEDRLRSRFRWGLITDIQPPELETRLAILRKKAERETTPVPDEVLEFIATHIKDNIRELEGAFIRVAAFASLTKQPVTAELAARVLEDLLTDRRPRPVTPQVILQATSEMFGFSIDDLQSKSRRRPLVTARQVGMYVTRELTELSYPAIGREFGGRDHTTAIHAVEKISALMKERRQIYDQVTELVQTIRSGR